MQTQSSSRDLPLKSTLDESHRCRIVQIVGKMDCYFTRRLVSCWSFPLLFGITLGFNATQAVNDLISWALACHTSESLGYAPRQEMDHSQDVTNSFSLVEKNA